MSNLLFILFLCKRKNGLLQHYFGNIMWSAIVKHSSGCFLKTIKKTIKTINLIGSTSGKTEIKVDTSLFVQKLQWRTNFLESNSEEYIDLENPFNKKFTQCY